MNKPTTNDDRVWRALADPVRRGILDALATGPRTTTDLVDRCPRLCRTAVMKHLDVLTAADLVIVRRAGRVRWNDMNPTPIDRVCRRWLDRRSRRSRPRAPFSRPRVGPSVRPDPGWPGY